MARKWSFVMFGLVLLILSGCGLFNPAVQEDNPQNPDVTLQVSTRDVTGQAGTFVLVPIQRSSKMKSALVYTKLILNYDPKSLEYAGMYTNTDQEAQIASNDTNNGRLSLELFGVHQNADNPDRIAFKILNNQPSNIQFHLIEAATIKGEHRQFANLESLNQQSQVAESRVRIGGGGLNKLPVFNTISEPSASTRGISPNLQVPAKLEVAWAGIEMGDLNGDKTISKADWEILLKAITGQVLLTPVQRYASDLRGDNFIDLLDFAYLLAKQLNVQYGQASATTPLVVVHADTEVVPGNAALVLVGNPLSLADVNNTKYTLTNTANWITDPISSTGSSTTSYSITAPIETSIGQKTILQTRSTSSTGYRVNSGTQRQILAITPNVGTAATLSVVPGALLFTEINQSKTLRVVAQDANGQPVSTAGLELQWKLSDNTQVKLVSNPDGSTTVTSLVASGSAVVSAVSAKVPDLTSNPVLTTMVGLRPGVVTIPDSNIVYPLTNTSTTLQPGSSTEGIAGFTGAEIASYVTANADKSALAPAILRGGAPAVGTYVVASESVQMLGQVTQVLTRGNYSLMQLQFVPLPEIFTAYKVAFNSEALVKQGLLSAKSVSQVSQVRTNRSSVAIGLPFPGGLNTNACDISGGFDAATLFLEPGRATITPIIDATAEYDADGPRVSVVGGFDVSLQVTAYLRVSATLKGKISCTIVDLPEKSFPIPGPFAAVLGVYFKPKIGLDASAQIEGIGGLQENLGYQWDYSGTKRWGFAVDKNGFRDLKPPETPFNWDKSGPINRVAYQPGLSRFQVSGQVFGYIACDFGAKLFPVLSPVTNVPFVPQIVLDQINKINQLTLLKFLTLKAGVSGILAYGGIENTIFRRYPSNGAQLNAKLELGFNVAPVNNFLKKVTGYQDAALDLSVATTLGLTSYYKGFSAKEILANSTLIPQPADAVNPIRIDPKSPLKIGRIVTEPAINSVSLELSKTLGVPDVWDYSAKAVRVFITQERQIQSELTGNFNIDNTNKDAPVLSGEVTFPADICDFIAIFGAPRVTIVVFNNLFNIINSPNYVGDIPIKCEKALELQLNPPSLNVTAEVGAAAGGNFEIQNVGKEAFNWEIMDLDTPSWIEVRTVKNGNLGPNEKFGVSLIANCPATPTTLSGSIRIRASNTVGLETKYEAVTLKCTKKGQPAPSGGDPGLTHGDPHLVGFDGTGFDFQAVGEFVLAKSSVDPFQVQVRFAKIPINVSLNQSYALNVNGDKVGIYGRNSSDTNSFDIVVNGAKQDFATDGSFYLVLPNGGQITANRALSGTLYGDFVDVRWTDGYGFNTRGLRPIKTLNMWGQSVTYIPSDKRGSIQGLLGNDNRNQLDDFILRDGTQLAIPLSNADLYGQFGARGNGWRIDQAESLFDYDPSTNTDTFTDLAYPSRPFSVSDIPADQYANAEAVCKAAGIVDFQTLINCVVDYYLTGSLAFVQDAKQADPIAPSILVSPPTLTLNTGNTYPFSASVKGVTDSSVIWSTTGGSISSLGVYTAPSTTGTFTVSATSLENPNLKYEVSVVVKANTPSNNKRFLLSVGGSNSSIIRSASIITWGNNFNGQLGIGNRDPQDQPSYPQLNLSSTAFVAQLANGDNHTLALVKSTMNQTSQVYAWGQDDRGQLGLANIGSQALPRLIPSLDGINIVAISSQQNHNLALNQGGQVYTWGANEVGQLGLGDAGSITGNNKDRKVPTLIPNINNIVSVSAGLNFSVALDSVGQVYTWGDNRYGQLGLGNVGLTPNPTLIPNLTDVSYIVAIGFRCFAITKSGQIYAWGYNVGGQLGLGNTTSQSSPALVSTLNNVVAFGGGILNTFALTKTGQVYGFGANSAGQLGLGDAIQRLTPTLIPNFVASAISACACEHYLAIANGGQLYAWGTNEFKQLGLGDTMFRSVPTLVPLPIQANRVVPTTPLR